MRVFQSTESNASAIEKLTKRRGVLPQSVVKPLNSAKTALVGGNKVPFIGTLIACFMLACTGGRGGGGSLKTFSSSAPGATDPGILASAIRAIENDRRRIVCRRECPELPGELDSNSIDGCGFSLNFEYNQCVESALNNADESSLADLACVAEASATFNACIDRDLSLCSVNSLQCYVDRNAEIAECGSGGSAVSLLESCEATGTAGVLSRGGEAATRSPSSPGSHPLPDPTSTTPPTVTPPTGSESCETLASLCVTCELSEVECGSIAQAGNEDDCASTLISFGDECGVVDPPVVDPPTGTATNCEDAVSICGSDFLGDLDCASARSTCGNVDAFATCLANTASCDFAEAEGCPDPEC